MAAQYNGATTAEIARVFQNPLLLLPLRKFSELSRQLQWPLLQCTLNEINSCYYRCFFFVMPEEYNFCFKVKKLAPTVFMLNFSCFEVNKVLR